MNRHSKRCRNCYIKAVEKDPEEWRVRHNAYSREWRAKHLKRSNEIARLSRARWRAANPELDRAVQAAHRYRVRREILDLIGGGKCGRCGLSDWRALHLDHIR